MEELTWTINENFSQPRIKAHIFYDSWNITTETGTNANLSVLENAMLLLMCIARYPVVLKKENEVHDLVQNQSFNQFFQDENLRFRAGPVKIPIVQDYSTSVVFEKVKVEDAGKYICVEMRTQDPALSISISLEVHHLAGPSNETPQFLQSGFDKLMLPADSAGGWSRVLIVTILYTVPPNAQVNETLDHPIIWREDTDNEKQMSIVYDWVTQNIKRATITWYANRASTYIGEYTFKLNYQLENGECVRISRNITLENPSYIADHADKVFSIDSRQKKFETMVTEGKVFEIRLYSSSPRVVVRPDSLVSIESIGVSDMDIYGVCHSKGIDHADIYEKCGILGMSMFDDIAEDDPITGLQITLNATNPCTIIFHVPGGSRTVSLSVLIINKNVFGISWGTSFSGPVLSTLDPTIKSGERPVIGDPLFLQCLVPACSQALSVQWCQHNQWCVMLVPFNHSVPIVAPPLPDVPQDPNIAYLFTPGNGSTAVYGILFQKLQAHHAGRYVCMMALEQWQRSRQSFSTKSAIEINPAEPEIPKFADGKENATEKKRLIDGETLTLDCNTTGHPRPNLIWSFNGEPIHGRHRESMVVSEIGTYYCNSSNRFGWTGRTYNVDYGASYIPLAIALPVAAIFALTAIIIYWWLKRRALAITLKRLALSLRRPIGENIVANSQLPLNEQAETLQYEFQWYEIDRESFQLIQQIGRGEYGQVWRGLLDGQAVAVKTIRDNQNANHYEALITELKLMGNLKPHVNVLLLQAACTSLLEKRELYIITELCGLGSLLDYMQQHQLEFENGGLNSLQQFSTDMILCYAYQAASGMEHLASQHILHRDIALRNCLLTEGHIVKISDFGLSRPVVQNSYYKKKIRDCDKIPLYWMALESISQGKYTKKSDVWSFGVLLWELFSCGRQPHPDYRLDTKHEVENFEDWLKSGQRLYAPRLANDDLYKLMRQCWDSHPHQRPTFAECREKLQNLMNYSTMDDLHCRLADAWAEQCRQFQQRDNCNRNITGGENLAAGLTGQGYVELITGDHGMSNCQSGRSALNYSYSSIAGQSCERLIHYLQVDDCDTPATHCGQPVDYMYSPSFCAPYSSPNGTIERT